MTAKAKSPSRPPSPIMNRLNKQFARLFEADFKAAKPQRDRRSSRSDEDPAGHDAHHQALLKAFEGFSEAYSTCAAWAPRGSGLTLFR